MTTLTPTTFVCWSCGCSDGRTNAADLPERCPGHDREPIDRPEPLDVLPEYVDRHDCGKRKCEAAS